VLDRARAREPPRPEHQVDERDLKELEEAFALPDGAKPFEVI